MNTKNYENIHPSIKKQVPYYHVKGTKFPYLVDFVEDNVRNRCIIPLVVTSLFITLVFVLADATDIVYDNPERIIPQLPIAPEYHIDSVFKNDFPSPRIKVINSKGPLD